MIYATKLADAIDLGSIVSGTGGALILSSQHGHPYFIRIVFLTIAFAGIITSFSEISSPILTKGEPSCLQNLSLSSKSIMNGSRGKLSGNRVLFFFFF
jgi:hypothetical protein